MLRIAKLESQLKQNSRNSSKSPSSDTHKKKPGPPRKRGGQKGHKGETLKMSIYLDDRQSCVPNRCSCSKHLLRQSMKNRARQQVRDIPDPKLLETEY